MSKWREISLIKERRKGIKHFLLYNKNSLINFHLIWYKRERAQKEQQELEEKEEAELHKSKRKRTSTVWKVLPLEKTILSAKGKS